MAHHLPLANRPLPAIEENGLTHRLPRLARRTLLTLAACLAVGGAPVLASAQQDDAEAAYRQARAAYKAGDYDLAVRHLQTAWAARPEPIFRFHMARSYEAAGRSEEAMQAAIDFISLLAEKGGDAQVYGEPLTEAWRLVERLRAAGKGGPLRVTLPPAQVCPQPIVTLGKKRLSATREGLGWKVEVPPLMSAGGDLSIRCEGFTSAPVGPSVSDAIYPWVIGAGIAATGIGGYFTARYFVADGELGDLEPVGDQAALGAAAREQTRTRQQRDDFGEAALIWGGVGVGLIVTGVVIALVDDDTPDDVALVPGVTDGGAAVWWQGRF